MFCVCVSGGWQWEQPEAQGQLVVSLIVKILLCGGQSVEQRSICFCVLALSISYVHLGMSSHTLLIWLAGEDTPTEATQQKWTQ